MGMRPAYMHLSNDGICVRMTNLYLSPQEGLGLHVKKQVKSGRQWFVARLHIFFLFFFSKRTSCKMLEFCIFLELLGKEHEHKEWHCLCGLSYTFSSEWQIFCLHLASKHLWLQYLLSLLYTPDASRFCLSKKCKRMDEGETEPNMLQASMVHLLLQERERRDGKEGGGGSVGGRCKQIVYYEYHALIFNI